MRQLRLRLRSSLIFILTALTLAFVLTFNALISSSSELNPLAAPLPSADSPSLWSAFHQPNIYDLNGLPPTTTKKKQRVWPTNADRLYQLVRSAREERPALRNSSWSLEKFLVRSSTSVSSNETHPQQQQRAESGESPGASSTRALTSMNEDDQRELRAFLLRRLQRWKDEHQQDPLITLAEIMHASLAQDEPA